MPHTLLVGLGRSGVGLHLPVLARLRRTHPLLFASHPIVGYDPRLELALGDGIRVDSLDRAVALAPPEDTVTHVCVPPDARVPVLTRLAELGYRRLVVEKPLAPDLAALAEIDRLRARHGLDLVVVTHWLTASLTRRFAELVGSGRHGPLETLTVQQDKPRFGRSARTTGHATAFDVEIPHAVALALALAGPAEAEEAGWTDPAAGPLAGAWLTLRHTTGTATTIRSDLTSPVRRREVVLGLRDTTVVGHYPVSAEDHHAQLRVGTAPREVFEDEALSGFLLAAYRYLTGETPSAPGPLALHAAVVRLLAQARATADRATGGRTAVRPGDHAGHRPGDRPRDRAVEPVGDRAGEHGAGRVAEPVGARSAETRAGDHFGSRPTEHGVGRPAGPRENVAVRAG